MFKKLIPALFSVALLSNTGANAMKLVELQALSEKDAADVLKEAHSVLKTAIAVDGKTAIKEGVTSKQVEELTKEIERQIAIQTQAVEKFGAQVKNAALIGFVLGVLPGDCDNKLAYTWDKLVAMLQEGKELKGPAAVANAGAVEALRYVLIQCFLRKPSSPRAAAQAAAAAEHSALVAEAAALRMVTLREPVGEVVNDKSGRPSHATFRGLYNGALTSDLYIDGPR